MPINGIFDIKIFAMDTEVILYPFLVIQEEMIDKDRFLCPSELNARSLRDIDPSHNLLGTAIRMWAILSFCFKMLTLIVAEI